MTVANPGDRLEKLRTGLASMPPGKLADEDALRIAHDLAQCWNDLIGSNDGGMAAYKLFDGRGNLRAEDTRWDPPVLKFQIERHGGLVLGSTRGEIQRWEINVSEGAARIVSTGRRQLVAMDARMDVKPLARDAAAMIIAGREAPQLKWASPNRVRIVTSKVIPKTNSQTTAGRRQRYLNELEQLLSAQGWRRIKAGSHCIFERMASVTGGGATTESRCR